MMGSTSLKQELHFLQTPVPLLNSGFWRKWMKLGSTSEKR